MDNYIHLKVWDEIPNDGPAVEVGNGLVISPNTLRGMWLLIYAGIKVKTCQQYRPQACICQRQEISCSIMNDDPEALCAY